jgi:hypothetical protein
MTISSGLLSSRQPRNVVWRNCSSSVHLANATSQTSFASTHWIFSGILGGFSTGGFSVKKPPQSLNFGNPFSLNPVAEWPK